MNSTTPFPRLLRALVLGALLLFGRLPAAERVALIIGNNAYTHGEPLRNPVNDARAVGTALRDNGFATVVVEDGGLQAMERAVVEFGRQARDAKAAWFHYSGHGAEVKGANYLVPVDAQVQEEFQVRHKTLALDQVLGALEEAGTPLKVVVLDCCRNNPFGKGWTRSQSKGLRVVGETPGGTIMVFATSPGKVAADGGGANSPFTQALVAALAQPGLEVEQIFKLTGQSVLQATGRAQQPWVNSSFFDSFVLRPGVSLSPASLAPRPSLPPAVVVQTPAAPTWRLPADLEPVPHATLAPLTGLAEGSREAQERQQYEAALKGFPLEAKSVKTGIVFRYIPAGTFIMGSPKSEQAAMVRAGAKEGDVQDEIQHTVTLSKGYWLGKFEVTQGQWRAVMGTNPSGFSQAGDEVPVEKVSWEDGQTFITKLSQQERVPTGTYRLPTEAEWEYACRAGTQTTLYTGELQILGANNGPALDAIAWYGGNSEARYAGAYDSSDWSKKQYPHQQAGTQIVGRKKANGFGLHDTIGNVWEWCHDWYGNYTPGQALDPVGPGSGSLRVFRGGCWNIHAGGCRPANRSGSVPGNRYDDLGLRLLRAE